MTTTKKKNRSAAPSAEALGEAHEIFVSLTLADFVSESEVRQLTYCLDSPVASPRGKRWAVRRVRQLAADADIVDGGVHGRTRTGPPAERVARLNERRARDRARTAATKNGGPKR